jgi:lipoprotein-releasing system permease protein
MKVWPFFSYFFKYLFFSKTRQRLLFIAVTGLFISSFSLVVIQGIMGGLQKSLVARSKSVHGSYLVVFEKPTIESLEEFKNIFLKEDAPFYSELETEVMLKYKSYVAPAKIHGLVLSDERPTFLREKDFSGLVIGNDLASKLKLPFLDEIQIITPAVTDSLMGEVPRFIYETLSDYVFTELPEVDEFEIWGRVQVVQNLLRQKGINQIRIFKTLPSQVLEELKKINTSVPFRVISWEEMNKALVWSLNLETKVMLFLFISMSLLVSIAITSGLLIFFSKIRKDLMSFWILGMSQEMLMKLCLRFVTLLSGITCFIGVITGIVTLKLLDLHGHDLMPNIFVERRFPVEVTPFNIILSLFIPFAISIIFSFLSYLNFKKENQSFISIVRSVG